MEADARLATEESAKAAERDERRGTKRSADEEPTKPEEMEVMEVDTNDEPTR